MPHDLVLKAVDEAAAAKGQVVACAGAAGKGDPIHSAGVVDVYGVAFLGGTSGDGLAGGVLGQQAVDLGLDVCLGGGDVRLGNGQGGNVCRKGDVVQRPDAGAVALGIQPVAVVKVLVVVVCGTAVDGSGAAGRCGRCGRSTVPALDQREPGKDHADYGKDGAQDAQQGASVTFQENTSCKGPRKGVGKF